MAKAVVFLVAEAELDMHFRFAKIKVATSVYTGGRNCPPDSSTAMGSRPVPCEKKKEKEKSRSDWNDFFFHLVAEAGLEPTTSGL